MPRDCLAALQISSNIFRVYSSADRTCPVVDGAIARFPIRYQDPRLCDDTPKETEAYNERCRQIAREMFFIMHEVRGQLN